MKMQQGINLALLFLIMAYLVVPFAAQFVGGPNWSSQLGISGTVISGIILILLIVFLMKNIGAKK